MHKFIYESRNLNLLLFFFFFLDGARPEVFLIIYSKNKILKKKENF